MNYQLTYIVPTEVSDLKELEKLISAINARIAEIGGEIKKPISSIVESQFNENFRNAAEIKRITETHKIDIFKHRLAYPIKHHRYGYYITVVFGLDDKKAESILKTIASELKTNKNILRSMANSYDLDAIANQTEKREKLRTKREAAGVAEAAKDETESTAETESPKENILTEESKKSKIEDLDKKLEQILNA